MKIFILLFLIFIAYIQGLETTSFTTAMEDLSNLEKYIKQYKEEKSAAQSLTHLIVGYIKGDVNKDEFLEKIYGLIPKDLPSYIEKKDVLEGTNAQATRTYKYIELPNNETIEVQHLFGVMNGIENANSWKSSSGNFSHVIGWGTCITDLLFDIRSEDGTFDELFKICQKYFKKSGKFNLINLISSIDAPILLSKKNDDNTFADIITKYYNGKEYLKRVNKFVNLTFPELKSKDKFREELFKIYYSDSFLNYYECRLGFRDSKFLCENIEDINPKFADHQKAAVYVVSDYLSKNYNENEVETDPDPEPVPDPSPSLSRLSNISIKSLFSLFLMMI